MADQILHGFDELAKLLREMPKLIAQNDLAAGAAAMAGVVKAEALQLVPVRSGRLRKAIYMRRSERTPVQVTYVVGARRGKGKADPNGAFYGGFVERGHFTRPGPKQHWVAAKPFLRPALINKRDAAIEALRVKLKARIEAYGTR
jgi:hypothetical protein